METFEKYRPTDPILKPLISWFVFWRKTKDCNTSTIVLPNNICGFGLTLSGNLLVKKEKGFIEMPKFGTRNILDKASEIKSGGDFFNISIRLNFPCSLYFFTKIPMNKVYENDHISLNEIFSDSEMNILEERLFEANDDYDKKIVIEKFLVSKLNFGGNLLFNTIIMHIHNYKGNLNVSYLAKEFKISEKSINRYFNKYIGISTVAYINLIKFRSVLNTFENCKIIQPTNSLDFGYYDQSHFIRHFKEFSLVTPLKFFEMLKSKELSDLYNF
ncbi:MAG TPA: helix-turn-helix domain-containing protein [Flavobacterium sp.]|nr:helix-turn-helix domain-containing protein [Flavobacterium sp.]